MSVFVFGLLIFSVIMGPGSGGITHMIIWLSIFSLVGFLWFGIKYVVTNEEVMIKVGPITSHRIDVTKISSIKRSYNPLSSPATSLMRLEIKYVGGIVLISPKNEREFVGQLKKLNPGIDAFIPWKAEKSLFIRHLL